MTDGLTMRLRNNPTYGDCADAADEIDRLTEAVTYLVAQLQDSRLEAAYWERQAHRG